MSGFSNVDASPSVESLVAYLRSADTGLASIKAYMAAAAARAIGDGLVIDVGCGLGYDLTRLDGLGVSPVGVDSSMEMLRRARDSAPEASLLCADAAALPFRSGSVDGCRVERVLQHVEEPSVVIGEMARVVRSGGCAVVFEPDYGTFAVESEVVRDGSFPAALMRVRNPSVGAHLAGMLDDAGFRVADVVTESSHGYSFDRLPVNVSAVVARAVVDGRCDETTARRWTEEQQRRSSDGVFRARWDKILVVATRR
jgi:ubiquinone/menaquinone biosynthesis C-methylase UbiE